MLGYAHFHVMLCRHYASACIVDTPVFFHADDWDSNISSAFLIKTD